MSEKLLVKQVINSWFKGKGELEFDLNSLKWWFIILPLRSSIHERQSQINFIIFVNKRRAHSSKP